jgi:hypothetical protein
MRGFVWLVLALLLFLAWVGSYIVYHVAGLAVHLLVVFALISLFIVALDTIRAVGARCGYSPPQAAL